jgi:hypothetical protein
MQLISDVVQRENENGDRLLHKLTTQELIALDNLLWGPWLGKVRAALNWRTFDRAEVALIRRGVSNHSWDVISGRYR